MLQLEVLQGLSHVLFPHPFYLSSAYSRSSGESFSSSELVSADLTGKLACINKTSSSVCSACLTFPGFLIHSFETLINSGQSNFSFFHRNFRSKSRGSDGGNKSKLGLSASPKGTTTPQSTTELFSPRLADTVFPPTALQKHRSRIIQTILKMIYRAGPGKAAYSFCVTT